MLSKQIIYFYDGWEDPTTYFKENREDEEGQYCKNEVRQQLDRQI